MKILVTGGFGFIGSSFIKYLNNKGITNIDICEPKGKYESKWFNTTDLFYSNIINSDNPYCITNCNYDVIVHLGANSSTNQEANSENWDNNIQYSNELIKRFNNHVNKPIFIFASSAATYGNETSDFSERLNVRPTNFYGFTKLETEKVTSNALAGKGAPTLGKSAILSAGKDLIAAKELAGEFDEPLNENL